MRLLCSLLLLSPVAAAQSFVDGTGQLPTFPANANKNDSENVDFADVDLDGDFDVICADGGDGGNDRNRLWINQGGAQGGTAGVFVDMTQTQYPTLQDTSRDVDFADIDGDGDPDVVHSNVSTISNQANKILVNQGGLQGGTAGFFANESSTRWVNLGVNDGVSSFSSVWPSLVLAGGFIDWSGDMVFGDLDSDGDMDMVHSSYGQPIGGGFPGDIPHRIFLNDGLGFFEEFNPSGFQLSAAQIADGDPALWASGTHQQETLNTTGLSSDVGSSAIAIDLGDLDGDFDLDLLMGARQEQPRLFRNELTGGALLPFVDVTHAAFTELAVPSGNYEQELGDLDGDNDLDIYGINWAGPATTDALIPNLGGFVFGAYVDVPGSQSDDEEADFFDYDGDGDLDVFIANFSGQDRLYENVGEFALSNVTASELPSLTHVARGVDSADVDLDGDLDLLVANDNKVENDLVLNVTQVADTHAPRVVLEQVSGPACGEGPVAVRAAVYDNASWEWMRYNTTEIEFLPQGGSLQTAPMSFAGGQLWRGELPAAGPGTIHYRVRSTDRVGNAGVSATLSYVVAPVATNYCTAGTSASGCRATLSTSGTPSATAPSGFFVHADDVEGSKSGLFYWSTNGQIANPWGNGTSWNCVALPSFRSAPLAGSGTGGLCDGGFSYDLTARWQQKPAGNPGPGAVTQLQLWYRDPQNTSNQTTSLSDAVEFTVCP